MPLHQVVVDEKTCKLALWQVTETVDELLQLCPSSNQVYYNDLIENMRSERRKKEVLASRILINQLCGHEQQVCYHDNGQPYLSGTNQSISISHSGDYVAVILSTSSKVGVDLEAYSDKALRVARKFMHADDVLPTELDGSQDWSLEVKQHVLAWSAKEAFYKYVGSALLVDYKRYLSLQADGSKLFATETATGQTCQAQVYYVMDKEYVLTWVL